MTSKPVEGQHWTLSVFYVLFCRNIKQDFTGGRRIIFQVPHERNTNLFCTRLCGTICNILLASYDIDSFLVLNSFTVMNELLVPQRLQAFLSPLLINGL